MGNEFKWINNLVKIITTITVLAVGYVFIRKTIFKPSVEVVSYDLNNGIAQVMINGKQQILYRGSTITAGTAWGVRFNEDPVNNRIELVDDKGQIVYKTFLL